MNSSFLNPSKEYLSPVVGDGEGIRAHRLRALRRGDARAECPACVPGKSIVDIPVAHPRDEYLLRAVRILHEGTHGGTRLQAPTIIAHRSCFETAPSSRCPEQVDVADVLIGTAESDEEFAVGTGESFQSAAGAGPTRVVTPNRLRSGKRRAVIVGRGQLNRGRGSGAVMVAHAQPDRIHIALFIGGNRRAVCPTFVGDQRARLAEEPATIQAA